MAKMPKMSRTLNEEEREEILEKVQDASTCLETAVDDIDLAQSCETDADLWTNIKAALRMAEEAVTNLKDAQQVFTKAAKS